MSLRSPAEVFYPETDGKPMAETDRHRDDMVDLIVALRSYFRHRPEVYVTGNILLYYVKGDNTKSVSPDVMVVKGVGNKRRSVYKTWEEGKGPDVVIEVSSRWTRTEDLKGKKELYEQVLCVPEYFLYDPLQHYLREGVRSYRLVEGRYQEEKAIAPGRWWSEELKLELVLVEGRLRFYDRVTKEYLSVPEEMVVRVEEEIKTRRKAEMLARREARARRKAEMLAEREAQARREAEMARREAEILAEREAQARREAEMARREAEILAEREAQARREAEAELARLRAELESLKRREQS